jgi:ribosomal protein L24E
MSAIPKYIIDERINWAYLSMNPNADAFRLLEQNPDNINWTCLSGNPNAIHLLEKNPDKIDWTYLSANPNADALRLLAHLDYIEMKRTFQPFAEELVETVFHPSRVSRIADVYGMDLNEYLEFL